MSSADIQKLAAGITLSSTSLLLTYFSLLSSEITSATWSNESPIHALGKHSAQHRRQGRWSLDSIQARSQVFRGSLPLPPPFPALSLPISPFPSQSPRSPTLSSPSLPSPPLEVRPLKIQLGGLGSAVSSPSGVWGAEPQPKSNLVHFSLKIWHLVAIVLMIFLRNNWPNFVQF